MALIKTSSPSDLVVSIDDLKAHLNLTHCDDDPLLRGVILAASEFVSRETGWALGQTEYELHLAAFPCHGGRIALPRVPLVSVDGVDYYDTDNDPQELLANVDYYVGGVGAETHGYLVPVEGVWPETVCPRRPNGVVIAYTVGASSPPELAIHAVRLLAAHLYEHRESEGDAKTYALEIGLERLLSLVRVGVTQ